MAAKRVRNYQELADLAGVSKATVSLALRNHPKVSRATRERINALAEKHGYRPNPLVTAQMAHIKSAKGRQSPTSTLAFIAPKSVEQAQKDRKTPLRFYYAGAKERAERLGFSLDYLIPFGGDQGNQRLSAILRSRGIRGIILAPLSEGGPLSSFELDWESFASVSIEHNFQRLAVHTVCNDEFESIGRLLNRLQRHGFKRIGLALQEKEDLHVKHAWLAGYQAYRSLIPARQRLNHFISNTWTRRAFMDWYAKNKPDVIICIDEAIMEWLKKEGVSVPQDVSLASLYWLPHRAYLSGYYQNHEAMGAAAVDLLTSQLYRNEFGLPHEPKRLLIQSIWREGKTLRPRHAPCSASTPKLP